jgi:hypothetical protein
MLDRRVTRLERIAPPPRREGPSAAAVMLNRVAALQGRANLTPEEQRELGWLWSTLNEAAKRT